MAAKACAHHASEGQCGHHRGGAPARGPGEDRRWREARSLSAVEAIPFGFKIALEEIPQGATIVKYGETIGKAGRPIPKGRWYTFTTWRAPGRGETWREGKAMSFLGYPRPDGSVGTRNYVLVIPQGLISNVHLRLSSPGPGPSYRGPRVRAYRQ